MLTVYSAESDNMFLWGAEQQVAWVRHKTVYIIVVTMISFVIMSLLNFIYRKMKHIYGLLTLVWQTLWILMCLLFSS